MNTSLKNTLTAIAATAAFALPAYAQDTKLNVEPAKFSYVQPATENTLEQKPAEDSLDAKLDGKREFSFFFKTGVHSKNVFSNGFIVNDGPVSQSLFSISTSDVFMKGDTLEAYTWMNVDLKSAAPGYDAPSVSEQDFGIDYSFPIADVAGGKLSGYLELATFEYWDGRLGDADRAVTAKLNYNGPVDVSFKAQQMLTSGWGRGYEVSVSKTFDLYKGEDWKVDVTPSVNVAYLDDLFGSSGFSAAQVGATVGVNYGDARLEAYVKHQEGLSEEFESPTWFGLEFKIPF